MKKIAILHFSPVELYPPVQNLIRQIESSDLGNTEVVVISTASASNNLSVFRPNKREVEIKRHGKSGQGLLAVVRYWNYALFFTAATFQLLLRRPQKVLYFETISSFPIFLYSKFLNSDAKVFVHYHEYTSPSEYEKGMTLVKYFHQMEKRMYGKVDWLSHTNEFRLKKFREDIAPIEIRHEHILPNYPPRGWMRYPKTHSLPVKVVYVGAVSLETMYLSEFSAWVEKQNGQVHWDIYTTNITDQAEKKLNERDYHWIKLKGSVDYTDLPETLAAYDVGVILYKGHTPNYIYNAPNKLFEYLACGLDVWFPNVMTGSLPYCSNGTHPKVLALDFQALFELDLHNLISKVGLILEVKNYFCEESLKPLVDQLLGD